MSLPQLQLPIPWTLRALVHRPLSVVEELLEVLVADGEPLVAHWARGQRGKVRQPDDLQAEIERLEGHGGPVARSLAASVRAAWRDFAGVPLPPPQAPRQQQPLPL